MARRMIGTRPLTKEESELVLLYGKPISVYNILQTFSRGKPRFLPRCLDYKISARKNKMINAGGQSIYHYMGSNNEILRSQVVKKTTCPFCQMKCGSMVGVKHHLTSSHGLFEFNFRLSENGHPTFDVSVKPGAFINGVLTYDLEGHHLVNYYYRSKSRMRGQIRIGRMGRRKRCKLFEKYSDVVPRDNANELPHVNGDNISPALARTHVSENSSDIQTITQPEIGQSSNAKGPPVNGDNLSLFLARTPLSRKTTPVQTRTQPKRGQSSKAKGPPVNGDNISPALATTHVSENSSDIQTRTQPEIGQSSNANGPPVNGDNLSLFLARTPLSENSSDIQTRTQPEIGQSSNANGPPVNGDNLSLFLARTPLSENSSDIQTRTQLEIGQSSNANGPPVNGDNLSLVLARTPLSGKTTYIKTRTQPKRGQSSKAKWPPVNGDNISSSQVRTRLSKKTTHVQKRTQPEIGQSSKAKRPPATRRKYFHPRRIEAERTDPLQSRQFYHSRTLQPMTLEEVMSAAYSESESDEDFKDIQERLRLNQLVDASDEQKRFMSLWNCFIRRQRVLARKHVPWACEEFVKLHAKELIKPEMLWQWRAFAYDTLWENRLICTNTMDKCSIILENARDKEEELSEEAADAAKAAHAAAAAAFNLMVMATSHKPMELDEEQT